MIEGGVLKEKSRTLHGGPAGRPCGTRGQQPEGVLVLNARDERTLAWLIDQVGIDAVRQACGMIAGNRKPYPTNLARVLGLAIPESISYTPATEARERIRDLINLLSRRGV